MALPYTMIGQPPTDITKGEDGHIVIQQWDDRDDLYHTIRLDPLFVPTIIKWLQEITREAA